MEPGYEFNLSTEEMEAFRALEPAKGEAVEAAEAQLRRVLAERVRAYRAGGTAAIAPFARTDDASSSPGDELRRTTEAMHSLRAAFPAFHQALVAYPEGGIEHEEFWFWTRIRVLGRPVFMLHKRIAAKRHEVEMVVERQIYASHFLDVGQTVSATLPVQEGTLLFVVYRSWVDQWTGPGVTVGGKRKVGNELIAAVLRSLVERLRLCEGIAPAAP